MKLRQKKFSDRIRDIIAEALSKGEIPDSALSSVMITRVKVTPDLQLATIYFRLFMDGDSELVLRSLKLNKGPLRKLLAQELIVRRVPELRFFYDDVQDKVDAVEGLLHKIRSDEES